MDQEKVVQLMEKLEEFIEDSQPFSSIRAAGRQLRIEEERAARDERYTKAVEAQSESAIAANNANRASRELCDRFEKRRIYLVNLEIKKIEMELTKEGVDVGEVEEANDELR